MIRAFVILCFLALSASLGQELLEPSHVSYEARDQQGSWTGRAPVDALSLSFNKEHLAASEISISLRPGQFDSGNFVRDANARRAVFETQLYPEIRFTSKRIITPQRGLAEGETLELELLGEIELHGITRELRVPARISLEGGALRAEGSFSIKLSDFDMTRPSFLGVRVEDDVEISFVVGLVPGSTP